MSRRRTSEDLIAAQALLRECALNVARAEVNLKQEMGGYPSSTPGSGSPGGGKGGTPTVRIHDESDPVVTHHVEFIEHDDGTVERRPFSLTTTEAAVPVTSVERQVLFADVDRAAGDLRRVRVDVSLVAATVGDLCREAGTRLDYGPRGGERLATSLVRAFGGLSELLRLWAPFERHDLPAGRIAELRKLIGRVYDIVNRWSYTPGRPKVTKEQAELLAVDLTEQWCTSHLRAGDKRPRDRGELCQWCRKFRDVEGFVPPLELVRLHVENGRVYDHQVKPFRQAHRDRMRNMTKGKGKR